MTEEHKKRLIGAVVLVAMAVIFVPMLLDGGDPENGSSSESDVPRQPDHVYQTIDIPLQTPPQPASVEQRVVESEQQAAMQETPPPASTPGETTTTAPTPPPTVKKASLSSPQAVAPKPRTAATPTPTPEKSAPQSWVVQLGSFGKAANATALRDKARAKGFKAFVEQVKVDSGAISYRVRIGPELKRENAEAAKVKIAKSLGVEGVVMSHP